MSDPRRPSSGEGKKPKKKRRVILLIVMAAFVCVGCPVMLGVALGPLSAPGFCVQCHEMRAVYASWQESPHHTNSSGETVDCVSCHLPPKQQLISHLAMKAQTGARDIRVHLFSEYDEEAAQQRVLNTLPSEWCLDCHDDLGELLTSGSVTIVHASALEEPESEYHRCVACHDRLHGPGEVLMPPKEYDPADNSFCYVCHINFQTEEFVVVHQAAEVGCIDCHDECAEHQDDEDHVASPDIMYPKSKVNASCATANCHSTEEMEKEIGHRPFFANATGEQEYCTDCHGAHRLTERQRRWDKTTGALIEKDGWPVTQ